jgi:hypothetical protein
LFGWIVLPFWAEGAGRGIDTGGKFTQIVAFIVNWTAWFCVLNDALFMCTVIAGAKAGDCSWSMQSTGNVGIRITSIYNDIYKSCHLNKGFPVMFGLKAEEIQAPPPPSASSGSSSSSSSDSSLSSSSDSGIVLDEADIFNESTSTRPQWKNYVEPAALVGMLYLMYNNVASGRCKDRAGKLELFIEGFTLVGLICDLATQS